MTIIYCSKHFGTYPQEQWYGMDGNKHSLAVLFLKHINHKGLSKTSFHPLSFHACLVASCMLHSATLDPMIGIHYATCEKLLPRPGGWGVASLIGS